MKSEDTVHTCWPCRLIGHKWFTQDRYLRDGKIVSRLVFWGACTRCGKPTPEELSLTFDAIVEGGDKGAR